MDVKDGGLSFRRDLYCEKIARTIGRKKGDRYWDRYGLNFFYNNGYKRITEFSPTCRLCGNA